MCQHGCGREHPPGRVLHLIPGLMWERALDSRLGENDGGGVQSFDRLRMMGWGGENDGRGCW